MANSTGVTHIEARICGVIQRPAETLLSLLDKHLHKSALAYLARLCNVPIIKHLSTGSTGGSSRVIYASLGANASFLATYTTMFLTESRLSATTSSSSTVMTK